MMKALAGYGCCSDPHRRWLSCAGEEVMSRISRRSFLKRSGATAAGALAALMMTGTASSAESQVRPRSNRTLLKRGTVLTLDKALGDFEPGDVLVEGRTIAAVGVNLEASDADVIDASNMIVMPGFVETHRHTWHSQLRNGLVNATFDEYYRLIIRKFGPMCRPEDAYIGSLLSAVTAIDAGFTTMMDWSHIQNTPEHGEAVVRALQESGMRAVFCYGYPQLGGERPWWNDTSHKYPEGIGKFAARYFASKDQLLTLALGASPFASPEGTAREWQAARETDARISIHLVAPRQLQRITKTVGLGPNVTYVHCLNANDEDLKMIAQSGGTVSLSPMVEMSMDLGGLPPLVPVLRNGIRPSLSVDVETHAPTAMFAQMQAALTAQRAAVSDLKSTGNLKDLPPFVTARDVVEFATIEGARANGLDGKVGTLTPGKQADIVLLRKDLINVAPISDPYGAVALGMDTSNVDTVFVAGKARKLRGKLIDVDVKRIIGMAAQSHDYFMKQS